MNTLPRAADRAALGLTVVIGAGVTVWTIVQAVISLAGIIPNRNVPVTASFTDTPATLPLGPGGAAVDVVTQQAVIEVSGLIPIVHISLILAEVFSALTVLVTVVCACLVIRNLVRGRAFVLANLGLVGTATMAVGLGFILTWLFGTMGANGAVASLGGDYENSGTAIDPLVIFGIAALGALTVAFQVGSRLQKETEGLV